MIVTDPLMSRTTQALACARRRCRQLGITTPRLCLTMYQSLCASRLLYGASVWGPHAFRRVRTSPLSCRAPPSLREAYAIHVQGVMWALGCRGESHSAVRSLVLAEASTLPLPHSIFLHAFRYASSLSRLPPTCYAHNAWEWHRHVHLTTCRSP